MIAVLSQRSEPVRRYVEETGLPFNILVDEDRAVAKQYGVWHRIGIDAWNISRPALFAIDRAGIIRAIWVAERQDEFPSGDEIDEVLGRWGNEE